MLYEKTRVELKKYGNNFAYILDNIEKFLNTDYKVLQGQISENFIPCMKILYNGKQELFYLVEEHKSFSSVLNAVNADKLNKIMINLLTNIIEVKNNGFLNVQNIDLAWENIFVDMNTLQVKLVYLPISVKLFDSYDEFDRTLRSNMIKAITTIYGDLDSVITEIISDTNNSLEDLCYKLRFTKIKRDNSNNSYVNNVLKMIAIGASEYFEIVLDKDEIIVGRKAELVDAVISFSKMVGRKHCRFVRKNGQYYVLDEGSLNGTFVNNQRVYQGQCQLVSKGDIIRLADVNFKIVLMQ